MRILLINQFFDPDPAATAQAATHLARRMVRRGHEVQVLTSRYSHIEKGAVLPTLETIEGVRIRRVGGTNFGRSSLLGRMIDAGTFYAALAMRAITAKKPDALLIMSSPPMVETLAPVVRSFRGCWAGCWLMDMNPDITVGMGVLPAGNPLMRLCKALGGAAMRRMDHVITIGECMSERVAARGVRRDRISSVETGADPGVMRPLEHDANEWRREQGIPPRRPVLMYSGNFGTGHPLTDFFEAFKRLVPNPDHDPGFEIYMIGGGVRRKEAEEFEKRLGSRYFHLLPYQPLSRLNESLAAGDVHLISQATNMVGAYIPSKVYGVMSVGRPFVFAGPAEATVGRIAEEGPCGIVAAQGDVEALVRAIERLMADAGERARLGANARRLLESRYASPLCEDRLIDLLEREVSARTARSHPSPAGKREPLV